MNKQMEFGFLITLGLLTTMSVGTLIHNENSNRKDALSTAASGATETMRHTSQGTQSSSAGNPATNVINGFAMPTEWAKIATDLSRTMSINDWKEVVHLLLSQDPTTAANTLHQLINEHLTPEDKAWVQKQYQGSTAITPEDGILLLNSLNSTYKELTPSEQNYLMQTLSSTGADANQNAVSSLSSLLGQ
jgi:hypothetical protein